MASLLSFAKKAIDQINPLDNGRTYQNSQGNHNPGPAPSAFQQLTHNGATNFAGGQIKAIAAAPIPQLIRHGPSGFLNSLSQFNQSIKPTYTPDGKLKYNPAIGNLVMGAGKTIKTGLTKPAISSTNIGASIHQRIPVRQIPSHQEQADRYNAHMANLSKEFGRNQVPLTTAGKPGRQGIIAEPSVYNDVAYQAKKQQIEQAYKDGTLSKPIKVSDAPKTNPKLPTPPKTNAPTLPSAKIVTPKTLLKDEPKSPAATVPLTGELPAKLKPTYGSADHTAGKEDARLAEGNYRRREIGETGAAIAKSKLKITNTLSKKEQANLAGVMKGVEAPLNSKVTAAAQESKAVLDKAYTDFTDAGLTPSGKRQNYFPQIVNPKTFKEGTAEHQNAVNHLLRTKQAKDVTEAKYLLREHRKSSPLSPRVSPYQNLTKPRELDLPDYAKNVSALNQYLDRTYASIGHARVYGAKDEVLNKIFNDIEARGGNVRKAQRAYQQASGLISHSERLEKASRIATNFQGATKLGLSFLGNASQRANNAVVGGVGRAAKAQVSQHMSDADKAFVQKTGVTSEQVAHEALFGEQGIAGKTSKVTAPFFEKIEKGNRSNSAITGRDQAIDLAKKAGQGDAKAAKKLYDDFGIRTKDGNLTEPQQIKAARAFVQRTQFRTSPGDLPGFASGPVGRAVTQFKRYPYKQAAYLKREIIDEARGGNFAPLVRQATVGTPIALGTAAASSAIRGNAFNQSQPEKILDKLNDATGASLATSLPQGLYPSSYDANAYTAKVGKTLGGPTISDAIKTVQAGYDAGVKHDPTNAGRLGLTHIPLVGTPASSRLMPYKTATSSAPTPAGKTATPAELNAQSTAEVNKLKSKQATPDTVGLTPLPNGKYVTQSGNTISTHDTLAGARLALAKDKFTQSGDSYKVVGDTVLRKGEDGKVTTETKTKFDYDLGTATLTQQKNNDDVQGYLRTANQQIDRINKQLFDSSTDPVERLKLQNDATALRKNIAKYTEYGGFTKAGSSSSKAKARAASFKTNFKTTSIKTPKIRGVKVGKVASSKPLKTRKISVSKMPKIT